MQGVRNAPHRQQLHLIEAGAGTHQEIAKGECALQRHGAKEVKEKLLIDDGVLAKDLPADASGALNPRKGNRFDHKGVDADQDPRQTRLLQRCQPLSRGVVVAAPKAVRLHKSRRQAEVVGDPHQTQKERIVEKRLAAGEMHTIVEAHLSHAPVWRGHALRQLLQISRRVRLADPIRIPLRRAVIEAMLAGAAALVREKDPARHRRGDLQLFPCHDKLPFAFGHSSGNGGSRQPREDQEAGLCL